MAAAALANRRQRIIIAVAKTAAVIRRQTGIKRTLDAWHQRRRVSVAISNQHQCSGDGIIERKHGGGIAKAICSSEGESMAMAKAQRAAGGQ
jgi:hypothetical protein